MAQLVAEVIGVVAGVLATIPISQGLFEPPVDQITTVKIVLGEATDLAASLSGNRPGVALWDDLGQSIGTSFGSDKILPQSNHVDVQIAANSSVGNAPPSYVSIINGGDDAICVAWVTVTFPDGAQASWSGDTAFQCNADFFESSRQMGTTGPDGTGAPFTPHCVWIDRNHSNGLRYQGLAFHMRDFFNNANQATAYGENPGLMCNSGPRFRMYETLRPEDPVLMYKPPLEYTDQGTDADPTRIIGAPGVFTDQDQKALQKVCQDPNLCDDLTAERCAGVPQFIGAGRAAEVPRCSKRKGDKKRRNENSTNATELTASQSSSNMTTDTWKFEGHLVISARPSHSARTLCERPNSYGPSFASIQEGLFCDMKSRLLYDICDEQKTSCCLDMEQNQLRSCSVRRQIRGVSQWKRQSTNTTRTYTKVHRWGMNATGSEE